MRTLQYRKQICMRWWSRLYLTRT